MDEAREGGKNSALVMAQIEKRELGGKLLGKGIEPEARLTLRAGPV